MRAVSEPFVREPFELAAAGDEQAEAEPAIPGGCPDRSAARRGAYGEDADAHDR